MDYFDKMKDQLITIKHKHDGSGVHLQRIVRIKNENTEEIDRPHRHDYYVFLLLEKGRINLLIDLKEIEINNQSLFISYPGQIHQVLQYSDTIDGWLMTVNKEIVPASISAIINQSLNEIIVINIVDEMSRWFSTIMQLLAIEDQAGANIDFNPLTRVSLCNAFLYKACSILQSKEHVTVQYAKSHLIIAKKFKQLLRDKYKIWKRPKDYSDHLNISVGYLNDTVKLVTRFSITYHIQQEVMTEAKRFLSYTNLSIKEISFLLGYEDVKYFARLFRKVSNVAPGIWRQQNFKDY